MSVGGEGTTPTIHSSAAPINPTTSGAAPGATTAAAAASSTSLSPPLSDAATTPTTNPPPLSPDSLEGQHFHAIVHAATGELHTPPLALLVARVKACCGVVEPPPSSTPTTAGAVSGGGEGAGTATLAPPVTSGVGEGGWVDSGAPTLEPSTRRRSTGGALHSSLHSLVREEEGEEEGFRSVGRAPFPPPLSLISSLTLLRLRYQPPVALLALWPYLTLPRLPTTTPFGAEEPSIPSGGGCTLDLTPSYPPPPLHARKPCSPGEAAWGVGGWGWS